MIKLVAEEYLFYSWNRGLGFWEPFKTEWLSWWLRSTYSIPGTEAWGSENLFKTEWLSWWLSSTYSIPGTEAWGSENISRQNDRMIKLMAEEYLFYSWNRDLRFWEPFKTEWLSWWLREYLLYSWNGGLRFWEPFKTEWLIWWLRSTYSILGTNAWNSESLSRQNAWAGGWCSTYSIPGTEAWVLRTFQDRMIELVA